jgi:hypothetical protein
MFNRQAASINSILCFFEWYEQSMVNSLWVVDGDGKLCTITSGG